MHPDTSVSAVYLFDFVDIKKEFKLLNENTPVDAELSHNIDVEAAGTYIILGCFFSKRHMKEMLNERLH